jgi:hypothetical protein
MKFLFRNISIFFLSFSTVRLSGDADIEQLMFTDLSFLKFLDPNNRLLGICIIAFSVTIFTNLIIIIFEPFIEIYLMYYYRFSFYLFINLISISTIFILLRVYGYSRSLILLYIFFSSSALYLEKKIPWLK